MITRANFFEILGRLSVLFSTLEAEIQTLLCRLLSKKDFMMAATVLEGNGFARTLILLKKASQFQDAVLESRVTRLLSVINPLRKKRNLFVHGCWDISPRLLDQGRVMVSDSKIKFEGNKNRKSWCKGMSQKLTYQELQEYQTEVMRGLKMAKELLMSLETDA
jgi:hypothetical protein